MMSSSPPKAPPLRAISPALPRPARASWSSSSPCGTTRRSSGSRRSERSGRAFGAERIPAGPSAALKSFGQLLLVIVPREHGRRGCAASGRLASLIQSAIQLFTRRRPVAAQPRTGRVPSVASGALEQRLPPGAVVQVPVDCRLEAGTEVVERFPFQLALGEGGIDRVPAVVADAVGDEADKRVRFQKRAAITPA